jgi:hypothetical protein
LRPSVTVSVAHLVRIRIRVRARVRIRMRVRARVRIRVWARAGARRRLFTQGVAHHSAAISVRLAAWPRFGLG